MANLWLTGEGEPTLGTGTMGDYYRDTVTNMVYFRENPTTWVVVPAFTPNPDGVGTTWIHGTGAPLNTLGSDTNYYYDDADKIVYYKDAGTWAAKGSLDFIGVYGVQWGNGSGAPANTPQLNNLPASSFYLDVLTSNIYFKNLSLQWELKGKIGSHSITVIESLTSTATEQAAIATAQAVIATAKAVLTGTDATQTALDVIAANADAVATAADRVQTGLDRTQTTADAAAAATSKANAALSESNALTYKTASEAARDAAIIGAGVYSTEAAGRAAVADGVAFKVQGSGDVAAYEYRRTNSTTSVLIATYPASSAVDKKVIGELGKNIFNKNAADVAIGYFPVSTTGNLQANASFNTTGFIPVLASTAYVVSTKHYWCWYDASKVFISGTNDSVASKTQTSPANAAYMRCSFAVANWDNAQVELGTAPSSFEQFRYFLPVEAIKNETITTGALAAKAVTPAKTNFLALGKNLFNKTTITAGFYLTNAGVAIALANHRYSDFIPVTAGVQYYGSATGYATAIRMYCFYDANFAVLAGGSNATSSTFTAPTGAAYVRVTLENTYEDSFQLEVGAAATAYEVYAYRLSLASGVPIFATQDTSTISSLWMGKTWATLGDSITNASVYQVKVASMFGLTYTNFGVSGSTLCGSIGSTTAMCQDTRINAIATTFDLVTVLAGTNDWAQSFPLGATNSTDPLTFNGALNTLLSKLSTRFATKRIVMMTTTYGEYSGGVGAGWANSTVNLVGLTSLDYAEAVRAACKRWGVPCIDLSACGWNSANIATYVADGLHPNTTGYRRMSEVIIGGLKAITPLV